MWVAYPLLRHVEEGHARHSYTTAATTTTTTTTTTIIITTTTPASAIAIANAATATTAQDLKGYWNQMAPARLRLLIPFLGDCRHTPAESQRDCNLSNWQAHASKLSEKSHKSDDAHRPCNAQDAESPHVASCTIQTTINWNTRRQDCGWRTLTQLPDKQCWEGAFVTNKVI